ncbi:MAG: hypothetical protein ACJ8AT_30750 [Hyalangium sp.]|uniref:hypothetical protein n=1 Tax=Hyalangium sp. TaxID=2028555 RepID=UPI00389A663A
MTSYNAHKLFSEIESVVKSNLPVTEGLLRVIQFCERELPHPDWAALRPGGGKLGISADLHLIGAPLANDPKWIFGDRWGQDTPDAESNVLAAIYQIAYEHKAGLKNDAEYPLCLAYANLAIRHLAQTMGAELLRDADQRVLHVGFDSGDFLCIGAIRKEGLIFSKDSWRMT